MSIRKCIGLFPIVSLLSGCANHPPFGLPLVAEDADRIKTIEVVTWTYPEPLRISRTRYDYGNTAALRTMGSLGNLAAIAMESSANSVYIRSENEAREATKPLLAQVEGMDFREVLRFRLGSSLKKNGRFQITKITENNGKRTEFGSKEYAKNSDADAILFVDAHMEINAADLWFHDQIYYRITSRSGETLVNGMADFKMRLPVNSYSDKLLWWEKNNRYRQAMIHSVYGAAAVINSRILNRSDFISRETNQAALSSFKQPYYATNTEIPISISFCDGELPGSDEYIPDNYIAYEGALGKVDEVFVKCLPEKKD